MGSLFKSETSGVMRRYLYYPDDGDTSISGADTNGHALHYYDGGYMVVFRNGSVLWPDDEYESPDGETINLLDGREFSDGDEVLILVWDAFAVADHYDKKEVRDYIRAIRVGEVVIRIGSKAEDEVVLDGSTHAKADLPELWDYANESGNLGSDDSNFEDIDDDNFRVPDWISDERFIRAVAESDIGREQQDQMQRITGRLTISRATGPGGGIGDQEGALTIVDNTGQSSGNSVSNDTDNDGARFQFDSADSPNARTSSGTDGETRPINTGYLPCIKAGRVV